MNVEVVDPKQLDAGPDRGKQAALDLNALRRQCVDDGSAFHPVDEPGDPDRDDYDRPLTERCDHCGIASEQWPFDLSFLCALVFAEIGVAEAALDCRGLDRFTADRARLAVVAHIASASQPRTTNHPPPTTTHQPPTELSPSEHGTCNPPPRGGVHGEVRKRRVEIGE